MRKIAFWLSLSLIFTIPWENLIELGPDGTISLGIGLGVAAFWGGTVLFTGRLRRFQLFHLIFFLFLLWTMLSVMWSLSISATVDRIQTYAQLFIMGLIFWDLYTTERALKIALQTYVLGAYVSVISLLVNYVSGLNESGNAERAVQRFSATGFNSDDVGIILALGLPVAWYLATNVERPNGWRFLSQLFAILNFAYIPIGLLGIALTGTRAALVASVPALLYVFWSLFQLRLVTRIGIFALLVSALFVLQPLVPASSLERLSTTGDEIQSGDLNGRMGIWRESLRSFREYPILGTGSGAFRKSNAKNKVAHNSFLSVLVETGVVGFALFSAAIYLVILNAWLLPPRDSYFWLTTLLVWGLGASTLSWEPRKQTWLFLSLVIVAAAVRHTELTENEPEANRTDALPYGIVSTQLKREAIS